MPFPAFRRAALACALVLLAVPSAASAAPRVTLTIPDADAGSPIAYSYTASGVRSGSKLVIQRAMGTAQHFRTVAKLPRAAGGQGSLPAQKRGLHSFRIAVIGRKGKRRKVVLVSRKATARVFELLTFAQFFDRGEYTRTLPTRSFTYVFDRSGYSDSTSVVTPVSAEENSCRAVHVDWVPTGGDSSASTGQLLLVQESRDAVTDTAVRDEISALDAQLAPKESWGINFGVLTPSDGMRVYVNGTVSCYATARG